MLSETTWERPNRFRGEAPLFYAASGSLQDTDAIIHFALDGGGSVFGSPIASHLPRSCSTNISTRTAAPKPIMP